jgi:hypothetical protein
MGPYTPVHGRPSNWPPDGSGTEIDLGTPKLTCGQWRAEFGDEVAMDVDRGGGAAGVAGQ